LQTDDYKGFIERYIPADNRERPPVNKIDWGYPVMWWKGKNKLNNDNLGRVFGDIID
jgi:hypothetical protein